MSGQTFQPGERVRFSGEGTIQRIAPNTDMVTVVGTGFAVDLPLGSVEVEHVAPPGWPGQPGDRWGASGQIWMTCDPRDNAPMVCTDGRALPADDVLRYHGPVSPYLPIETINEWRTRHGFPAVPGGDSGAVSTSDERLDRTLPGWDDASVMPQISHVTGDPPLLIDPPAVRDPALDETQIFPRIEDERPW